MKKLIIGLVFCGLIGRAEAAALYVAHEGAHVSPYGSWAHAATSIQAAVDAAVDGDIILITNGLYGLNEQVSVSKAVTLRGVNGAGYTTVDGGYLTRCFHLSNTGACLEGLTVTRGVAYGGGGVSCSNGGHVVDCVIRDCRSTKDGGGLYVRYGTVSNCQFYGNSSSWGGGLLAQDEAVVDQCFFSGNHATNGGGGLYAWGAIEVKNCTADSNTAGWGGGFMLDETSVASNCLAVNNRTDLSAGGIYLYNDAELHHSTVVSNYARYGGGLRLTETGRVYHCAVLDNEAEATGGGLYLEDRSSVSNLRVSGNKAVYGGGLALDDNAQAHDCVISNNLADFGGGIRSVGGQVRRSRIVNNTANLRGGGHYSASSSVYPVGAVLSECRITGNQSIYGGGAYLSYYKGPMENCLVADNTAFGLGGGLYINVNADVRSITCAGNAAGTNGGGLFLYGGAGSSPSLANTIVSGNTSPAEDDYAQEGAVHYANYFRNNCLPNALGSPGQVTNAPLFVDAAGGDYRLQSGSPCIDTEWAEDYPACDLAGVARPVDGDLDGFARPDIGAYEFSGEALGCSFRAEHIEGTPPFHAVFHSHVIGTNLNGLVYHWDFDNDGISDLEGSGLVVVTNAYSLGMYSVRLRVSNLAGEEYTALRPDYIEASLPETFYVAHGGAHVPPFTNWVMAATNMEAALTWMRDDDTVVVSNGVYTLRKQIVITNGVTVTSANGAPTCIFDGNYTTRCFYIAHTGAVLDQLTITRGSARPGGGIYSERGGVIQGCTIVSNTAYGYDVPDADGGGVYLQDGGEITHCRLEGNTAVDGLYYDYGRGSAVFCRSNGLIRNCVAARNESDHYRSGTLYGGFVENCTVVKNTGSSVSRAHVRNTISYGNSETWTYLCTFSNSLGSSAILRFVDYENDNYRLLPYSSGVDEGDVAAWMTGALDLAGNPRIMGDSVDFGAYETDTETLSCWFTAETRVGPVPAYIVLSGMVFGTNTTGLYYQWDIDGDGTMDFAGYDLHTVTSLLMEADSYYPSLSVSNAAGETAVYGQGTLEVTAYARLTNYVSKTGGHISPYTSWATAATNINAALNASHNWGKSGEVYVAEGTYQERISVMHGVTVKGVDGPTRSFLLGSGSTSENMLYHGATLDGFTITAFRKGVCIYDGTLQNCHVVSNTYRYGSGAGIEIVGPALVDRCLVAYNHCNDYESGGGVCAWHTNAIIRNSIIKGNMTRYGTGGGIYGGQVYNCTVVDNYARYGGGVAHATAYNSILVSNRNTLGVDNYYDSDLYRSCTTPMPIGIGNIDDDPRFVVPGSCQLAEDSPCVDAGTNMAWMTDAQDYNALNRIYNEVVDMGASEYGYPWAAISVDPDNGLAPLQVTCTAIVQGLGTGALWYAWDFDRDGMIDCRTTNTPFASFVFEHPGRYQPALSVSNGLGGYLEIDSRGAVYVADDHIYVSRSGTHQFPYTNWAMAATGVSSAIRHAAHGMTIWITNGVYEIWDDLPVLDKGAEVRSVNGADQTTVKLYRTSFHLNHSNAVLDGLTLSAAYNRRCLYIEQGGVVKNSRLMYGYGETFGGNVFMLNGGMLTNCIIERGDAMYGGGVFIKNAGEVFNCIIQSNTASRFGAGVAFDYGGLVANSVLCNNSAGSRSVYNPTYVSRGGGANFNEGGLLRNCLVTRNYAVDGGGVFNYEGRVESCTIADNESLHAGGAVVMSDGAFNNSIMHAADEEDVDVSIWVPGAFEYCCASMYLPGAGNVNGYAGFINPAGGNYRVRPGSPCIDRGRNESWMYSAQDMDGRDRILGQRVDIGVYEYVDATGYCNFSVIHDDMEAWEAVFVPFVSGLAGTLYCGWDFDNDGVIDLRVAGLHTVTNIYTDYGTFGVSLVVSNQAGEQATYTREAVVTIAPRTLYVAPVGGHVYPYAGWDTAATNLQTALDLAGRGSTVWVTNGVYQDGAPYLLAGGVHMRSVNGSGYTVIDGNHQHQCLIMAHVDAVADGFTFRNGYTATNGGGVYCAGVGTITNCVIHANRAGIYGGGVLMYHRALLTDSHLYSNRARYGGGAYCYDEARIERCRIEGNQAINYGGGVYLSSARLENSIIADNYASDGGGVDMRGHISTNATVLSHCTIVGNRAAYASRAAGLNLRYGRLINSIVYDNAGLDVAYYPWGSVSVEGCLAGSINSSNTVLTNAPMFMDATAGDYRLQPASPCIDAGVCYPWTSVDINGVPRPMDGNGDGIYGYDIGACEAYIYDADSDRDGLSDGDEIEVYLINPLRADTDGDGQSDRAELIARTDPGDIDDFFAVRHAHNDSAHQGLVLRWMSSSDCLYMVYSAESLTGAWSVVPGGEKMPGTDDWMEFTAPRNSEQGRFYRVMTYPMPGRSMF
ncbi:MAG: hypothetical protein EOM20_12140 [Spartobacteria bacterium]|nr:hypothetical protein [Spartobacteria bacterium]